MIVNDFQGIDLRSIGLLDIGVERITQTTADSSYNWADISTKNVGLDIIVCNNCFKGNEDIN
jgi:hypothetical protein